MALWVRHRAPETSPALSGGLPRPSSVCSWIRPCGSPDHRRARLHACQIAFRSPAASSLTSGPNEEVISKQDGCCNHGQVTADASPLPSGIVTFVFTDIEGSTRLLRRLGDGYIDVLDRHHELLRRAWAAHGGHEINTEDSFFVAFDQVGDAARDAPAGSERFSQRWPEGVRVRVRMGVHVGLAAPVGSEYIALAVHQAARVSAVAHGGQVVLSEQAAGEDGARDVGLAALGGHRVRDFERPVRLFQLVAPGLRRKFPAVRAVPADQHNLAVP